MRRVIRQAAPLLVGSYAGQVLLFALFAVIARTRGDAFVGEFAVLSTTANILGVVLGFGAERWMLQTAAQKSDIGASIWTLLRLHLWIALLVGLPAVLVMHVVDQDVFTWSVLPWLWIWALAVAVFNTLLAALHGRKQMLSAGGANVFVGALALVAIGTALTLGSSLAVVVMMMVVVRIAGVGLSMRLLKLGVGEIRAAVSIDRGHFAMLCLFNLVAVLYQRIDTYLLLGRVAIADLGQYATAYRILDVLMLIPLNLSTALFPSIADSSMPFDARIKLMRQSLGVSLALACALAIGTTLLVNPIVDIVFGVAYKPAATMLSVLVWGLLFHSANPIFNRWLSVTGHDRWLLFVALIGVTCNVLLNVYMIPIFGVMGAVFATLGSFAAVTCAYIGISFSVGAFAPKRAENTPFPP